MNTKGFFPLLRRLEVRPAHDVAALVENKDGNARSLPAGDAQRNPPDPAA